MAGSKKYFSYTTDNEDQFGLLADESNTEAVMGTEGDLQISALYTLPRNVRPRYAVYQDTDGRILKCYLLTVAKYNSVQTDTPTITHDGRTYTIVRKSPEKITMLPVGTDTGLNDGDAS